MRTVLHLTEQELRDLVVAGLKARNFQTTGGVRVNFVAEPGGAVGALVENMREATDEEREAEEAPKEAVAELSDKRVLEVTEQVLVREGLEGDLVEVTDMALETLGDHRELEWDGNRERSQLYLALRPRVETALGLLESQDRAELAEDDGEEYWKAKRKPRKKAERERRVDVAQATAQRDTHDAISGEPISEGTPCAWISGLGVTVTHPSEWPRKAREKFGISVDDPAFDRFLPEDQKEPAEESSNAAADILGGEGGVMDRSDALEEAVGGERPAAPRRKGGRRRGRRVR